MNSKEQKRKGKRHSFFKKTWKGKKEKDMKVHMKGKRYLKLYSGFLLLDLLHNRASQEGKSAFSRQLAGLTDYTLRFC